MSFQACVTSVKQKSSYLSYLTLVKKERKFDISQNNNNNNTGHTKSSRFRTTT